MLPLSPHICTHTASLECGLRHCAAAREIQQSNVDPWMLCLLPTSQPDSTVHRRQRPAKSTQSELPNLHSNNHPVRCSDVRKHRTIGPWAPSPGWQLPHRANCNPAAVAEGSVPAAPKDYAPRQHKPARALQHLKRSVGGDVLLLTTQGLSQCRQVWGSWT